MELMVFYLGRMNSSFIAECMKFLGTILMGNCRRF